LVGEGDTVSVLGLPPVPDKPVACVLHKADGSEVNFEGLHTFSDEQVEWFRAGSALNIVRKKVSGGR
jgi:aconitate hydratase